MAEISSEAFAQTRDQLHWAAQLLSAAADVTLEKADDDSHSNLAWEAATNSLQNRAGCNIKVVEFALECHDGSLDLVGKTLAEAATWLGEKLNAEIRFRDYEMPANAVQNGAPFSPDREQLMAAANQFTFAQKSLSGNGELRIWPHHFDLGFWSPSEIEGKSIGGGFSLGDQSYNQPYFYINPYGIDKPESLPQLRHGHWSNHWFGAVLTTAEMDSSGDAETMAAEFVALAIEECEQLILADIGGIT